MAIQQMLLGAGGASKKTYMDDVFSTYLYTGNATSRSINNGVNLSEGGLVWIKNRSGPNSPWFHVLADSARGSSKIIRTNGTNAEYTNTSAITSFNNNGFSLGSAVEVNGNDDDETYASWSFKEAPGFFDIVTWTGDGNSNRQISHNLGCVPGMILTKAKDAARNWGVYHRSLGATHRLFLDNPVEAGDIATFWSDVEPTSTNFTVGPSGSTNEDGLSYIAYVFAGGVTSTTSQVGLLCCNDPNSTTTSTVGGTLTSSGVTSDNLAPYSTTARNVFSGTDNYIDVPASSNFAFGTGDFTIEMYINAHTKAADGSYKRIYMNDGPTGNDDNNIQLAVDPSTGKINVWTNSGSGGLNLLSTTDITSGDSTTGWFHIALVRVSGLLILYVNGDEEVRSYWPNNVNSNSGSPRPRIGAYNTSGMGDFDGEISNVRVIKGFANYTTHFTSPTYNFTTTTKPYDSAAFTFGENEDQAIVKCGSYVGTGSAGLEVITGFEPQWLLVKNTSSEASWILTDSMRGIFAGSIADKLLYANGTDGEDSSDRLGLTPTGFITNSSGTDYNANGDTYIYMAIRRPDGYVGKPASVGTDVFAIDTGNGSTTGPAFDANFAVDTLLKRAYASQSDFGIHSRLAGPKDLRTNTSDIEGNDANGAAFDYMHGASKSQSSSIWGLMWKRHAGFDVVTYTGNGADQSIPHSLSKPPEMIWVKARTTTADWRVYHKGLNGGTNPEQYFIYLNDNGTESSATNWDSTAPTSTHFSLDSSATTNEDTEKFIALLFASVDGISKVGSYTGNGGASITISGLGFSPRLVIVKNTTNATWDWLVLDTTRGFASGNDAYIYLNSNAAQATDYNFGQPTSDGFTWSVADGYVNQSNSNYIYYAHA